MNNNLWIYISMLIIGVVVGTITLFLHFKHKTKLSNLTGFNRAKSGNTLVGHLRKFYLISLSIMFYLMGISAIGLMITNHII